MASAAIPDSPWAREVGRLRCLRGFDTLTAVELCCEIGDFQRFAKAGQLMSCCGTVLLIGWRAAHGEFPVRFGQIEYERRATNATTVAAQELERRVRTIEVILRLRNQSEDQDERG